MKTLLQGKSKTPFTDTDLGEKKTQKKPSEKGRK